MALASAAALASFLIGKFVTHSKAVCSSGSRPRSRARRLEVLSCVGEAAIASSAVKALPSPQWLPTRAASLAAPRSVPGYP
jgi:hypothetical protein